MRLRPRADFSDLDEARAIADRLARPLHAAVPAPAAPAAYARFEAAAASPTPARQAGEPPVARPVTTPAEPERQPAVRAAVPGTAAEPVAEPPKAAAVTVAAAPAHAARKTERVSEAELARALETAATARRTQPPPAAEPDAEALVEEAPFVEATPEPEVEVEAEPGFPEPGAEPTVEPTPEAEEAGGGAESLLGEPEAEGPPSGEWVLAEEPFADESPLSALSDMVSAEPEAPAPPSWDELIANARDLADAVAGMVIGPDGRLLAATDGWPAVGAAAIANKLLPMVAPKLANPGALVPVKLSGQILSVWRLEVEDQLVTAAMLAEKALPVIVRPDIDELLGQGSLSS